MFVIQMVDTEPDKKDAVNCAGATVFKEAVIAKTRALGPPNGVLLLSRNDRFDSLARIKYSPISVFGVLASNNVVVEIKEVEAEMPIVIVAVTAVTCETSALITAVTAV